MNCSRIGEFLSEVLSEVSREDFEGFRAVLRERYEGHDLDSGEVEEVNRRMSGR